MMIPDDLILYGKFALTAIVGWLGNHGWKWWTKRKDKLDDAAIDQAKSTEERINEIIDGRVKDYIKQIQDLKKQLQDQAVRHDKEIKKWESLVSNQSENIKMMQKQMTKTLVNNGRMATAIKMAISFIEKAYPDEDALVRSLREHIKEDHG